MGLYALLDGGRWWCHWQGERVFGPAGWRDRLGLRGYSTHSNRRTWVTRLDKAGVRLKAIQDLGGWSSMAALQRYLEVLEEEKVDAISHL